MQIALPDELKEWCYYDLKIFSWQLKENAPEKIKDKFKEYQEDSLERYN